MKKKRRRKLSFFGKIVFGSLGLLIVLLTAVLIMRLRPTVVLKKSHISLEVNETFVPEDYIKKIKKGTMEDVVIDNPVSLSKPGNYEVTYTLKKKSTTLEVEIKDSIAPVFEVKQGTTSAGGHPDASDFVLNVIEQSAYEVYFKEDYTFDSEGYKDVVIVVEDSSKNKTEKQTTIEILPPDHEKPVIEGEDTITTVLHGTCDPLIGVYIEDNQDEHPKLKVIESNVNTHKVGSYKVTIEGSDQAGNKTTFKRNVEVVEYGPIGSYESDHNDVVFLTFDDGPSYNTPKVLEILKEYDIKATFFVTGMHPDDNHYIKQAYEEGHTIGLHTSSHVYADIYADESNYFEDLNRIATIVEEQIGFKPHYIRFPGGSSNTAEGAKSGIMTSLSDLVLQQGYQYYDWNLVSGDANGVNVPVDTIIATATNDDNGNIILLFHDGVEKDTTPEALPKIIEYYLGLGFRFAPISDQSYTCHHGIYN